MSDDFQSAFETWLAFLRGLGFAAEVHFHPPATEAAIAAAEAEIGFRLPDDLRALYLRADGQTDIGDIADPAPGTIVTPLFGDMNSSRFQRRSMTIAAGMI